MEFRNLPPFSVMQYRMLDKQDESYQVIAMKVGFSLEPGASGVFQAQPMLRTAWSSTMAITGRRLYRRRRKNYPL